MARLLAFAAAPAAALFAAAAAFAAEGPGAPREGGGGGNVFAGDIGNALWTVVIFVLVVVVLGKYAWGPLLSGLQAREAYIRDSLETARRDRTEAEDRLREYQEKLASARAEATAIIDEGRRDAEAVKHKIEEQAKQESAQIIARAKREIEAATVEATRQLYAMAGHLATELAARVIGRELDPKDHERLIAESIAEIAERHN